jgi:hypothetical protein
MDRYIESVDVAVQSAIGEFSQFDVRR